VTLEVTNVSMKMMAGGFGNLLHAVVVDETGLQGDYAFSYRVNFQSGGPPDPALLAKSLQEQLGLTLEATPLNVDTIDVVSVKPAQEVLAAR
jgi:uncharacterized protein (TIGR03435 family)